MNFNTEINIANFNIADLVSPVTGIVLSRLVNLTIVLRTAGRQLVNVRTRQVLSVVSSAGGESRELLVNFTVSETGVRCETVGLSAH